MTKTAPIVWRSGVKMSLKFDPSALRSKSIVRFGIDSYIVGLSTSDVNWLGRETEGYVFVAFVLWIILYSMSKYSKNIEKRYNTELDKEKL